MKRSHKIAILISLPVVLALAVLMVLFTIRSEEGGGPGPEEAGRNPFGVYSPGSLIELPAGSARAMIETLGVESYSAFQDFNIELVCEIGISWTRVDFDYTGWGFVEPVDYLEKVRVTGLEVVGCARPYYGFVPADLESFQANLRRLVERYPWIKTWQIGNEPNISFQNPDEYPDFFLAGSSVIRETCPDCRIMLGGVASGLFSKQQAQGIYETALLSIAAKGGETRPFDIFDMHYYGLAGTEDELLSTISDYRRMLAGAGFEDVEMWLTETATHTGELSEPPEAPFQTEEDQAAELVSRFVMALGEGMARVSWARPYENYGYDGGVEGYYDNTGLVYNGLGQETARGIKAGSRKLSWHAYRTLVDKVGGFEQVNVLAPDTYEFIFGDGRSPVYVLWDEGTAIRPQDLLPESARGEVLVTDITGSERLLDSSLISPSPVPVFVEER